MNKLSLKQALFIMAVLPVSAMAQGTNDGLGGGDVDIKSLYELVSESLTGKLAHISEDAQKRLSETLERVINEGSGGLICIIL